jgi:hypothetical protein
MWRKCRNGEPTLDEWLKVEGHWSAPEKSAKNKAESEAMEGTWLETITMTEHRDLQIATWQYLPGVAQTEGFSESLGLVDSYPSSLLLG